MRPILDRQPELTILIDAARRGCAPGTLYLIEPEPLPLAAAEPAQEEPAAQSPPLPAAGGEDGAGDPLAFALGPEPGELPAVADAHGMSPEAVMRLLDRLGASPGRLLVLGCEPLSIDEGIGLSPPVAAAVGGAVEMVLELVRPACQDGGGAAFGAAEAGAARSEEERVRA